MTSKTPEIRNYWVDRIEQLDLDVRRPQIIFNNYTNLIRNHITSITILICIWRYKHYSHTKKWRMGSSTNESRHWFINGLLLIREADKSVQRAEYYVVRYLEQVPEEERSSLEGFYDCYLSVLHSEVAMRAGNNELARRKMGHVYETFPKLRPLLRKMFLNNIDVRYR